MASSCCGPLSLTRSTSPRVDGARRGSSPCSSWLRACYGTSATTCSTGLQPTMSQPSLFGSASSCCSAQPKTLQLTAGRSSCSRVAICPTPQARHACQLPRAGGNAAAASADRKVRCFAIQHFFHVQTDHSHREASGCAASGASAHAVQSAAALCLLLISWSLACAVVCAH
jgi:hypothetical protein